MKCVAKIFFHLLWNFLVIKKCPLTSQIMSYSTLHQESNLRYTHMHAATWLLWVGGALMGRAWTMSSPPFHLNCINNNCQSLLEHASTCSGCGRGIKNPGRGTDASPKHQGCIGQSKITILMERIQN